MFLGGGELRNGVPMWGGGVEKWVILGGRVEKWIFLGVPRRG